MRRRSNHGEAIAVRTRSPKNVGDLKTVKVDRERVDLPRDWFFYTHRLTVVETDRSDPPARRLILFTFAGAYQDYRYWFTEVPYLPASKYGAPAGSDPLADNPLDSEQPETEEEAAASSYMLNDTIAEGCIEAAVKVAPT